MKPDVVADVGNTRVKWGLCAADGRSVTRTASLPEDPAAWEAQLTGWGLTGRLAWAVASVRPQRSERLRGWLEARGDQVLVLSAAAQLPLKVGLEHPDKAGIDRLLDAVAAKPRLAPGQGAVLIDAGSAVTADWLDEDHVFRGGAIFPGLDLMAEALHSHTALLPRVEVSLPVPSIPAAATIPATQAGVFLAVSGGIREAVRLYAELATAPPLVFFTGGQAPLLARAMGLLDGDTLLPGFVLWPEQTLVGILLSAGAAHE